MKSNMYRVYFGTTSTDASHGIYMAEFDTEHGTLGQAKRVSDAVRPGFIVIHPDGKHLYATDASSSFTGGRGEHVSAYTINSDGSLSDLNTQPSGGQGPCHISLSPDAKTLLAANYRGGSCAILPIHNDGTLRSPTSVRQHNGSGPNSARQETAHTHSFNCTPDGQFALAADLGIDEILSYRLQIGKLTPHNVTKTAPGAGPRHLVFHPSRPMAYVSMELTGTVSVYAYEDGSLAELQTLPTLPDDFCDDNTVSEVCLTPDGRFLYVGNRGHDSLAIFKIDPVSGKLTAIGHQSTLGEHPRHFNIDPTGTFIIVANMHSNNIVVFRIDRDTGQLTPTNGEIIVSNASCVQFMSATST
jgi:6-phosphogluconolactonase